MGSLLGCWPTGTRSPTAEALVADRFRELAELQDNYDGYHSIAPTGEAIHRAETFLDALNHFKDEQPMISPTTDGGVVIDWSDETRALTLDFADDAVTAYVQGDGFEWETYRVG